MEILEKINSMAAGLDAYLRSIDFNYFEYNYFPQTLYTKSHWINVFLRLFYRLSPINFRKKENPYPPSPQSLTTLLKAYSLKGDRDVLYRLLSRLLTLKSPRVKNFALQQGIYIACKLYEHGSLDPSPLNTVWFAQFILDNHLDLFSDDNEKDTLISIGEYLIEEVGYIDYHDRGIYFNYVPGLKEEIVNASATISALLLRIGHKYGIDKYYQFGESGIRYIVNRQNEEGSWFYTEDVKMKSVDGFHQSYILQALFQARPFLSFSIDKYLENGIRYYKERLFKYKKKYVIPLRYDRRYLPFNTWLFQKMDGRDMADALILFSRYRFDKEMLDGLINYMYDNLYMKRKGYIVSEILVYGRNKIPYLEFQGWYLYALETVRKNFLPGG